MPGSFPQNVQSRAKTMKQLATSELHPQSPQMPSPRLEIKKPQSLTRLWLLTGILVLALIVVGVAALQASKTSPSTKTQTQAAQSRFGQAQPGYLVHDTHEPLTVGQVQWRYLVFDTHEPLTVAPSVQN